MSNSMESHHHQQQQHESLMNKRNSLILQMKLTTAQDHQLHKPTINNNQTGFYTRLVGSSPHQHHPSIYLTTHHHNLNGNGNGNDNDHSVLIPQVTVVLEGRSICQRISLDKHSSYHSLAKALRRMFVDAGIIEDHHLPLLDSSTTSNSSINGKEHQLDLSNAIPGHLIAYEDMEDDLLLAGDLNWKDFVRVTKRIRVIPVKANSRRGQGRGRGTKGNSF